MTALSFINFELYDVDARDKRGHDERLAPALDNIEVRSK